MVNLYLLTIGERQGICFAMKSLSWYACFLRFGFLEVLVTLFIRNYPESGEFTLPKYTTVRFSALKLKVQISGNKCLVSKGLNYLPTLQYCSTSEVKGNDCRFLRNFQMPAAFAEVPYCAQMRRTVKSLLINCFVCQQIVACQ